MNGCSSGLEGSGAPKILMDAAEENLRTWRFYTHKATSFTVTFAYMLEEGEVPGFANPTIVLQLPTRVEIRTKRPKMGWDTNDVSPPHK
jgi:hypothetical protein